MRIVQIIDSLEAGGAERMAVNYANALADEIEFSGLVATRKEGNLRNQINNNVPYLFLNKKRTVDFVALFKLRNFVKQHRVTNIHAHSTSFFIAFLLKLSCFNLHIIWHDHYGDSEYLQRRPLFFLSLIAPFFSGIIVVNQKLKRWSESKLKFKNILYLPNFPSEEKSNSKTTILKGINGKRILSLANLRVQKDHFLVLKVAKKVKESHPDWTFHLVGKDFEDSYSQKIKDLIQTFDLEKNVFLYGSKQDIGNIIKQSDIGILTSQSEGLPVSLLEYGCYKKPVVVTNVGDIPILVKNEKNGFLVEPRNAQVFYDSLVRLIGSDVLKEEFGLALYDAVVRNNSKRAVIELYLNWLQNSFK